MKKNITFYTLLCSIHLFNFSFNVYGFSCIDRMKETFKLQMNATEQEIIHNVELRSIILNHYEELISSCPFICEGNPEIYNNLGIIYHHSGNYQTAENLFKIAITKKSNEESGLFYLGKIYEHKQLFTLALDCYLKIIELNPYNIQAKNEAKSIINNQGCQSIIVNNNEILTSDELYNTIACARVYNRAKKQFKTTRKIIVMPVIFRNIYFKLGCARLSRISLKQMNNILNMLNKNKKLKIVIKGHTDNIPVNRRLEVVSNEFCRTNQCLSEYRALSVKRYLVKNGIDRKRLTIRGYADTMPYDLNNNSLNRRVEVLDLDYDN